LPNGLLLPYTKAIVGRAPMEVNAIDRNQVAVLDRRAAAASAWFYAMVSISKVTCGHDGARPYRL